MKRGPEHRDMSAGYRKLEVIPGRIAAAPFLEYPGQPMAYFVREAGTVDTLDVPPGSIYEAAKNLFGLEALDFIVGNNSPEKCLEMAEKMKTELENAELQRTILDLYQRFLALREKINAEMAGNDPFEAYADTNVWIGDLDEVIEQYQAQLSQEVRDEAVEVVQQYNNLKSLF